MPPAALRCQVHPFITALGGGGGNPCGEGGQSTYRPFQAAARAQADVCKGLILPRERQGNTIAMLYCLTSALDTC